MSVQKRRYQVSKCSFLSVLLLAASPAALGTGPVGGGTHAPGWPTHGLDQTPVPLRPVSTVAHIDDGPSDPNATACLPDPIPAGWYEYNASQMEFYSRVFTTPYDYCLEGALTLDHEVTMYRNVTVPEIAVPGHPELNQPAFQKDIPLIDEVIPGTRVREGGNEEFWLQVIDYFPFTWAPEEIPPDLAAANFADALLCATVGGDTGIVHAYGYLMSFDTPESRSTVFLPLGLMSDGLTETMQIHGQIQLDWLSARSYLFTWCRNAEGDAQYQACARGCDRVLDQNLNARANSLKNCLRDAGWTGGGVFVACMFFSSGTAFIGCLGSGVIAGWMYAGNCGYTWETDTANDRDAWNVCRENCCDAACARNSSLCYATARHVGSSA